MTTRKITAVNAIGYSVNATPAPHVGVLVEITIATPDGPQALPAFWLPPDQARNLARALESKATEARAVS